MRKLERILIIYLLMFLLGNAMPFDEFQLIMPPADNAIPHYWLDTLYSPRLSEIPLPPGRNVPTEYRELFEKTSNEFGLPHSILESLAFVESGFRADAQSPARADGYRDLGMFQFNSKYHQWYSDRYNGGVLFDPFDPAVSINIAAQHMQFLFNRYGNWYDAFLAYNAGMDRIDRFNVPESAERYLTKIYRSGI